MMGDLDHDDVVSLGPLWEVAAGRTLGGPVCQLDPRILRDGWVDEAGSDVTARDVMSTGSVAPSPENSIDRLLIAQATVDGIASVTADATIQRYSIPIRRV